MIPGVTPRKTKSNSATPSGIKSAGSESVDVTQKLRSGIKTWYENSTRCSDSSLGALHPSTSSLRSTVSTAAIAQVTSEVTGEHGIGVDQHNSCIEAVVTQWCFEHSLYTSKLAAWQRHESGKPQSGRLPPAVGPRKPEPIPTPEDRLSASSGKASQIVESLILFCEVWDTVHPDMPCPVTVLPVRALLRLHLALTGLYMLDLAEAYLKLKLATLDAYSKHQSLAEFPAVKSPFRERAIRSKRVFPGANGLHLGQWLCRSLPLGQSFVFWMKRSAPRVSESMLAAQANASFDILTTPQEIKRVTLYSPNGWQWSLTPSATDSFCRTLELSDLVIEVRRTAREVLKASGRPRWPSIHPFRIPSQKAHFTFKRQDGGAREAVAICNPSRQGILDSLSRIPALRDMFSHLPPLRRCPEWEEPGSVRPDSALKGFDAASELQRRSWTDLADPNLMEGGFGTPSWSDLIEHSRGRKVLPFVPTLVSDRLRRHRRHYGWPEGSYPDLDDRFGPTLRSLGLRPYEEELRNAPRMTHFFDDWLDMICARDVAYHAHPGPNLPSARIVPLAEPLKVRTITAGDEEEYYWSVFIQKFIHGLVKKHETFSLIGTPLTIQHIQEMFRKPLGPGQFFVSGDYKSATDLISALLSASAADEIAEITQMPSHIRSVFQRCLTQHTVHLTVKPSAHQRNLGGEEAKTRYRSGPQANGQLMGSPVSFPILCIVNAALTRYSKELASGRPFLLTEMPLLINGDDVGFVATPRHYEIWKSITGMGGLVFSLGKNFTSRDFLVLNSCMFECTGLYVPKPMRCNQRATHWRRETPDVNPPLRTFQLDATGTILEDESKRMEGFRIPYASHTPTVSDWSHEVDCKRNNLPLPLSARPERMASPRNVFRVTDYQNPDYLGPVGRYRPPEKGALHLGEQASSLPAFAKNQALTSLADLFDPDNYAILPGLQKSWLANSRGSIRHQLNLRFIASWRPVLDLATYAAGGHKFSVDWFLPCGLGGLGLENTGIDGVLSSGHRARQLAFFFLHHPQEAPCAMPNVFSKSEKDLVVQRRIKPFRKASFPASASSRLDQDHALLTDVLQQINRSVFFEEFGYPRCYGPVGSSRKSTLRTRDLELGLSRFRESRVRLIKDKSLYSCWSEGPEISQCELDSYVPPILIVKLLLPPIPKVDLSSVLVARPPVLCPEMPSVVLSDSSPPQFATSSRKASGGVRDSMLCSPANRARYQILNSIFEESDWWSMLDCSQ